MPEPRILPNPPIVEAVVDIDCDMPPQHDLAALEAPAREVFRNPYPTCQPVFSHEGQIELYGGEVLPEVSGTIRIHALRFLQEDEKQLVQVRTQGFSFNRLAPYSNLDDYLPEIARTWRLFVNLASPTQVRVVRLRYINRIDLPLTEGRIELGEYLRVGPQLPDGAGLSFAGFLNQHTAVEEGTGSTVSIILATQQPQTGILPIVFDITAGRPATAEPDDWNGIADSIQSLRRLKNRVFWNTLTDKCLNLFQ